MSYMCRWIAYGASDEHPFAEVMPQNDLREHCPGKECWCHPCIDDGVIVHNSMDQREKYERGDMVTS